jgi:hypothetical protein
MGDKEMKLGKKLLVFVLAVGCIGSMTACDISKITDLFGGESEAQTSSIENTESYETSDPTDADNPFGVITEMPEVKGENVAKSQWDLAFEYLWNQDANVTVTQALSEFYEASNVIGIPAHYRMSYFNGKYAEGRIWQSSYGPAYYAMDEIYYENYYEHIDYTGDVYEDFLAWRRDGKDEAWWVGSWQDLISSPVSPDFRLDYDAFTFDEEKGCYVAKNVHLLAHTSYSYYSDICVIFLDGKIYKLEYTGHLSNQLWTMWFTDYGTTTIERYVNPEDFEKPEGDNGDTNTTATMVTMHEWSEILAQTVAVTNVSQSMCYTFEYTDGTPNSAYESYMLLQENATHQYGVQNGKEYDQYYAKIDGVDYQYRLTDGVWTRSELGVEVTYDNASMASVFNPMQGLYDCFTYNTEMKKYTCEKMDVDLGNGNTQTMFNVEFAFENGKLVYFYYEMELTNENGMVNGMAKVALQFWNYGSTSFELPEIK